MNSEGRARLLQEANAVLQDYMFLIREFLPHEHISARVKEIDFEKGVIIVDGHKTSSGGVIPMISPLILHEPLASRLTRALSSRLPWVQQVTDPVHNWLTQDS